MISVEAILKKVDDLLLDEDRTRWPNAERLAWINEAPNAIVGRKPSALSRYVNETLVAGTRQIVTGIALMDVVRNIDGNGAGGRSVRRTDRQMLDDTNPDWHTGKKATTIQHFMLDDRAPREYYVYPPAVEGVVLETLQAVLPDAVELDGSLDIGVEYMEAVVAWVCYRCKFKDSENGNVAEAASWFQSFENALGLKAQADLAASPNQGSL